MLHFFCMLHAACGAPFCASMSCRVAAGIVAGCHTAFYLLDVQANKWRQQPGVLCLQRLHGASHSNGLPDLHLMIQVPQAEIQHAPLLAY